DDLPAARGLVQHVLERDRIAAARPEARTDLDAAAGERHALAEREHARLERGETARVGRDAQTDECFDESLALVVAELAPLAPNRELRDIRQIVRRRDDRLERAVTDVDRV